MATPRPIQQLRVVVVWDARGYPLPPSIDSGGVLHLNHGRASVRVALILNVDAESTLPRDMQRVEGMPGIAFNRTMYQQESYPPNPQQMLVSRGDGTVVFADSRVPPSNGYLLVAFQEDGVWRVAKGGNDVDDNPMLAMHPQMQAFCFRRRIEYLTPLEHAFREPQQRDIENWFRARDDRKWSVLPLERNFDTDGLVMQSTDALSWTEREITRYLLHRWTGDIGEAIVHYQEFPRQTEARFREMSLMDSLPAAVRRWVRERGRAPRGDAGCMFYAMGQAVLEFSDYISSAMYAAPVRSIPFLFSGSPLQPHTTLTVGKGFPNVDGHLVACSIYPAVAMRYTDMLLATDEPHIPTLHVMMSVPSTCCAYLEQGTQHAEEHEVLISGIDWQLHALAWIEEPFTTRVSLQRLTSTADHRPQSRGFLLALWHVAREEPSATLDQVLRYLQL